MSIEVDLARNCKTPGAQALVAATLGDLCALGDIDLDILLMDLESAPNRIAGGGYLGLRSLNLPRSSLIKIMNNLCALVRAVREIPGDAR